MADHFLFIDIVWMLNSATGFLCRPSKAACWLLISSTHSNSCFLCYKRSSVNCINLQTASRRQHSPWGGFGPIRSPTEKMKGKRFKQNHTPCQKKWCFAQFLVSVAATADTVVAKNVFWACDNNSQTSEHWKQTNEATCCIDLLFWQIALEWVSSCSHL